MSGAVPEPDSDDERQQVLIREKQRAKRVIKELREHSEALDDEKDEVLNPRSSALATHFAKAEENIRKAKTIDQALIDAQIFAKLSEFSRRQAAQLQSGLKQYDVTSFVDRLAQIMQRSRNVDDVEGSEISSGGPELDLHTLGRSIWNRYKTFPSVHFMYGNSDVQPRVQKAKRAGKRVKKGVAAVKPKEVTEDAENEACEADKQIREMRDVLESHGELNFWVFVVDPSSYTRSIENVFHSSFLVKEGHAKLDLQSDPPLISFNQIRRGDESGVTAEEQAHEFEESSQYIMRFDYSLWRNVCEKYNIKKCMLPSTDAPKWDELSHLLENGKGRKNTSDDDDDDTYE